MNLYELLGVGKTASKSEIRRAYQKAMSKHHPDRGGDPELAGQINQAYDTLISEPRRLRYDKTGSTKISSKDSAARDKLTALFVSWMISPREENPLSAITMQLQRERSTAENQLQNGDTTIRRARARIKKLKSSSPWLIERLESELSKAEHRRGEFEESLDALTLALKLLKDFDFQEEFSIPLSFHPIFGGSSP